MEEVRKKCEAVLKPPNEESAARARLWTARTKESFFSANGVLFLNVSEYACVLFALKGGTQARARSTEDGPQKNKKKNNATFGVQQTNWYKRVSVTQSSRYRSIYIDWQRSYDE